MQLDLLETLVQLEKRLLIAIEGVENRLEGKVRVEALRFQEKIEAAEESMTRTVHIGLEAMEKKFKNVTIDFQLTDYKIDSAYADLKGYLKRLDSQLAPTRIGQKKKTFERVTN